MRLLPIMGLLAGALLSFDASAPVQAHTESERDAIEPLSLEARGLIIDDWMEQRIETVLPDLMRRTGIDMWILISRENNEDPTLMTMLPSDWFKARRRTILVLTDRGIVDGVDRGVEALAVARYDVGTLFKKAWEPETQPDQWARLVEIIAERNPTKIGLNQSDFFAQADGLVATDKEQFLAALPAEYEERIVSAEKLAIGWLETRIQDEIGFYRVATKYATQVIEQGFSDAVIEPGKTHTSEVEWWMLERIKGAGLDAWFPPTVTLQRQGGASPRMTGVIERGDLLHVDIGVTYLRLNTDTQRHAYVLREGETEAPASLQQALRNGNQLQDILTNNFVTGQTGNEILLKSLSEAREAGLRPSIYSHPIGYYGHGSGPTIGMWDKQEAIPVNGDYPLYPMTAHSIELNNTTYSEEWDQDVVIQLEESSWFDGQKVDYLFGRQTEFYLVRD